MGDVEQELRLGISGPDAGLAGQDELRGARPEPPAQGVRIFLGAFSGVLAANAVIDFIPDFVHMIFQALLPEVGDNLPRIGLDRVGALFE